MKRILPVAARPLEHIAWLGTPFNPPSVVAKRMKAELENQGINVVTHRDVRFQNVVYKTREEEPVPNHHSLELIYPHAEISGNLRELEAQLGFILTRAKLMQIPRLLEKNELPIVQVEPLGGGIGIKVLLDFRHSRSKEYMEKLSDAFDGLYVADLRALLKAKRRKK